MRQEKGVGQKRSGAGEKIRGVCEGDEGQEKVGEKGETKERTTLCLPPLSVDCFERHTL